MTADTIIDEIYLGILERIPLEAERDINLEAFNAGHLTFEDIARALVNSEEYLHLRLNGLVG